MSLRQGALLLCLPLLLVGASVEPAPGQRPNVVVIMVDDLGYGDLSSYGATDVRTPHIDGLASTGLRFEHFYANSPVCSPSRAALLTGRFPDLVGVPGVIRTNPRESWGYLDPRRPLLPELLRNAGYHTALVGKWHLGLESPNLPHLRGFTHSYAFLGDMMDDFVGHRRHGINYMRSGAEEIDPEGHATDLFTREAVRYVRGRRPEDAPFFLYLAYNAPHVPVQPPEAWLARVRRREPALDEKRAALVAFIEHMDDGIGQVLQALREAGIAGETLVIFTSDNGGELRAGASNGRLRGTKTEMYEGGIRVPTIAAWPGRIRPGTRSDAVLLSMDLFPTILQAAKVTVADSIDGRSFLDGALGAGAFPPSTRDLVWVRREGGQEQGHPAYAIRRGDWKLVHNRPWSPFELFNLREDPAEKNDRAASDPRILGELGAALRLHVQRTGRVPWQPTAPHQTGSSGGSGGPIASSILAPAAHE